jgi:hypothetical protein
MLLKQQHQQFVAPVTSAKRGWLGFIGLCLGSSINPNPALINMSDCPDSLDSSANRIATRYLDFGLEGHR